MTSLKEGDELTVTIDVVDRNGMGIARYQGIKLFVPHSQAGDKVRVRISRLMGSCAFTER